MLLSQEDFFHQIVKRVCSSLDLETSLQQSLQYIQHFIPADFMVVNLYEPELKGVRNIAQARIKEIKAFRGRDQKDFFIPLSQDALQLLESIELPHSRILNQPMEDPVGRCLADVAGSDDFSCMVIYMEVQDKWIGNLGLAVEGKAQYTEEHLGLFSLLKDPFAIALSNALRHEEILKLRNMLIEENRSLLRELHPPAQMNIVGRYSGLKDVMDMVNEVAYRESPVLLLGETGVGKDMIAGAIHHMSPRRDGPFVKVNCGAIPETLIDSELFGHEKGAFTGAADLKRGRFERANKGTIFLDEIGELPLNAQVRLLNVLHDREIERVGGIKPIKLDIRIIAATNRDLVEMIKEERFRLDLWYRLKVFPIVIPPLRERREDLPELVRYFIEAKAREMNIYPTPAPARSALDRLTGYSWPGNIRELENLIERALIISKGRPLTFDEILGDRDTVFGNEAEISDEGSLKLDDIVFRHIRRVLSLCNGQIAGPGGAAEILGLHPNTLRHKMKILGIPFKRAR